jgi:hypothetical protein
MIARLEEMLKINDTVPVLCNGNFILLNLFVKDQKKEALQAAPNLLELLSFCFFIGGISLPSRIPLNFYEEMNVVRFLRRKCVADSD